MLFGALIWIAGAVSLLATPLAAVVASRWVGDRRLILIGLTVPAFALASRFVVTRLIDNAASQPGLTPIGQYVAELSAIDNAVRALLVVALVLSVVRAVRVRNETR